MQEKFFRLTLDTTMAVLFGRQLDKRTEKSVEDEAVFAKAFDDAQHMLAVRGRFGDVYWAVDSLSFRRSCRTVHKFVDNIVADAIRETNSGSRGKDVGRYVFLRALIAVTQDPIVLRDQCVNILLGGKLAL